MSQKPTITDLFSHAAPDNARPAGGPVSPPDRATARPGRLATIAPGVPFLDCLAKAVLSGQLPPSVDGKPVPPAPAELAALTIFLPTRRACRALQDAFLKASKGQALLLPALRPVGDLDDDFAIGFGAATAFATDVTAPSIDPLNRTLLLAKLIQAWRPPGDHAGSTDQPPAQAIRLAQALATLLDEVETERASLDGLGAVVPEELSAHWQTTLSFLNILTQKLPAALVERGLTSPAVERNAALARIAAQITQAPENEGIIVAGVTGSVPATIDLMAAVLAKPRGAVILPGLDMALDPACEAAILGNSGPSGAAHPEHPQFTLARVTEKLRVARNDVRVLHADECDPTLANERALRSVFITEAMRPAATTDAWATLPARVSADDAKCAFARVHALVSPTALDEAEVVSLILREAIEHPGRTAALISPDRLLARRVVARLATWGIEVDDSAGRPLRKTEVGTLFELILTAIRDGFPPVTVTALLKHPLVRLGLPVGEIRRRARNFEIAALRAVYLGRGLDALQEALAKAHRDAADGNRFERAVRTLSPANWTDAQEAIDRFQSAFEPWKRASAEADSGNGSRSLAHWADAVVAIAEALAEPPPIEADGDAQTDPEPVSASPLAAAALWSSDGGETAADILARLMADQPDNLLASPDEAPDAINALLAGETVRPSARAHPRITIWGPYEARLMQPDVVVLGGLNEGVWPSLPEPGPWINRPMRTALGLPAPEAALGRAAHDFCQFMAAETVYLTRADKVDGKPTVPSRWLLRLDAILAAIGARDALNTDRPWTAWAAERTQTPKRQIIDRPRPCPPISMRPTQLSVTDIERWIANPYALYAAKILKLSPMPMLGAAPDAADRGSIVHAALNRFAKRYPEALPDETERVLCAIARELLADYADAADVAAFWQPRFERFATWFAATEPDRREGVTRVLSEVSGALDLDCERATLTLTARADRIDLASSGLRIYDYKGTQGLDPLAQRSKAGRAPQLLLEAAMAARGAFAPEANDAAAIQVTGPVQSLALISTAGGDPPGAIKDIRLDDIAAAADAVLAHVTSLADAYADVTTPYQAMRRPGFDYRYDVFAHLARVAEWSADDSEPAGDGS